MIAPLGAKVSRRAFLASATSVCALPCVATAQSDSQLTIATAPIDSGMIPWVAERAGFYRKYGLTVKIEVMNSGAAGAAAVVGGSVQVNGTSLMGLIDAHNKNIPFAIVAPASIYVSNKPSQVLLVRKDSPIHTAADLNGKIVASPALRDLFATTAAAWIDQNGGDSKTVHQIELAPAATQNALESGRIDAASVSEPRASQLLNAGTARILGKPYDLIAKSFLNSAFFATRSAVDANRDTYVRFARAHHDANVFANQHPESTAPWLAEIAQVPLTDILRGTRSIFATKLDLAQIQPVIDAAARFKVIDHAFDASELVSPTALGI